MTSPTPNPGEFFKSFFGEDDNVGFDNEPEDYLINGDEEEKYRLPYLAPVAKGDSAAGRPLNGSQKERAFTLGMYNSGSGKWEGVYLNEPLVYLIDAQFKWSNDQRRYVGRKQYWDTYDTGSAKPICGSPDGVAPFGGFIKPPTTENLRKHPDFSEEEFLIGWEIDNDANQVRPVSPDKICARCPMNVWRQTATGKWTRPCQDAFYWIVWLPPQKAYELTEEGDLNEIDWGFNPATGAPEGSWAILRGNNPTVQTTLMGVKANSSGSVHTPVGGAKKLGIQTGSGTSPLHSFFASTANTAVTRRFSTEHVQDNPSLIRYAKSFVLPDGSTLPVSPDSFDHLVDGTEVVCTVPGSKVAPEGFPEHHGDYSVPVYPVRLYKVETRRSNTPYGIYPAISETSLTGDEYRAMEETRALYFEKVRSGMYNPGGSYQYIQRKVEEITGGTGGYVPMLSGGEELEDDIQW